MKKSDITKIVIISSISINNPFIIEGKQKVNEFIELVDSDIIKKEEEIHYSNGYLYDIDFYNNEIRLKRIVLRGNMEIDGVYYDIVKGNLNLNKIFELTNYYFSHAAM